MININHMECCGVKELDKLSLMKCTDKEAGHVIQQIRKEFTSGGEYEQLYNWGNNTYSQGEWIPEKINVPAFIIFTQAGTRTDASGRGHYGEFFKDFIIANNLGTVHESEPKINANSDNLVTVFLWTVDAAAFKAFEAPLKKKGEVA